MQHTLISSFTAEVARARAAKRAELDASWGPFHVALERSRFTEERVVSHHETARREASEIRVSSTNEAEQILVKAKAVVEGILVQATAEAEETMATVHHRIPLTVGPPNPALAGEEARCASEHLLNQAKANADNFLSSTQQKLEATEEREAQVHAREESADSRAANLDLKEEVLQREQESRCHKEQLSMLQDQLNREREALELERTWPVIPPKC
jgi:hypothetical protein